MVRIITDSAADYEQNEREALGITCVPMTITFGDRDYADGVDLSKETFYKLLETEDFPVTSQPSPERFHEVFRQVEAAGDEAVVVLISSGLSGTLQGASLGRSMLDHPERVHLVDGGHATSAQRLVVDYAVKLRDQGLEAAEIAEKAQALVPRIRLYAVMDTLKYLQKGGRLTRTAAALGTLANLKPIIQLPDRRPVDVVGKVIGIRRALAWLVERIGKDELDPEFPIYTEYSRNRDNGLALQELLKKAGYEVDPELFFHLGPTVGAHIGPDAAGLVYVVKE